MKIYFLQLQSDYAFTLKSENELLNQDILTLEEELTKSKEERDKVGIILFTFDMDILALLVLIVKLNKYLLFVLWLNMYGFLLYCFHLHNLLRQF